MKKIKDFIKRNYLIIIAVICFFAFIPPITNLLVTTPSPIGFITPDTQETWIGFFGSIIGGGTTLFGVWWTIKKQKEQRRKDLAIQYRPFFRPIIPMKIDGNSFEENAFPNNFTEHSFETNYTKDIIVKIKNSGRGEAIINNIIFDSPLSKINKISVQHNNNLNDCIFPEQFFELSLHIIINDYDCLSSLESYYDFPITIEYTDFLKQNSYRKKICVLIKNASSDKENNQSTSTKFVVFIQEPLINEDEEE